MARAAPATKDRAKAWLFAASRAGQLRRRGRPGAASRGGLLPPGHRALHRGQCRRAFSAPTARTLRTNCRAIGRALAAYPEPAPVPLPRERAKKPYTAEEISAYLGLADAQPTPARAMRTGAVICLGAGAGLVGAELARCGAPTWSPVRAGWWSMSGDATPGPCPCFPATRPAW